jgi:hypothetical protein
MNMKTVEKNTSGAALVGVALTALAATSFALAQPAPQVESPATQPTPAVQHTPAAQPTSAAQRTTAAQPSAATQSNLAAQPIRQAAAQSTSPSQPNIGLNEIEALLQSQGIRVQELEVRDKVVEVEGRDANNREVEVIVDRRSGEILSQRFDD